VEGKTELTEAKHLRAELVKNEKEKDKLRKHVNYL